MTVGFMEVVVTGLILIGFQVLLAALDGYWLQIQVRRRGVNGYSLMEHGGFWGDIFIVIPIVAYITSRYHPAYLSWYSAVIFALASGIIGAAGYGYAKKGEEKMPEVMLPDSYVHDGRMTDAGWVHLLFAAVTLYILLMFYFTPLRPKAARHDILGISLLLTPFFFLGICKFTRRWKLSPLAQIQVTIQLVVLWAITGYRLIIAS